MSGKLCVALEKVFYRNNLWREGEEFNLKDGDTKPPSGAIFADSDQARPKPVEKVFTAGKQSGSPVDEREQAKMIQKANAQADAKVNAKDGAPKGTK